jgi:hypothetical protein
MDFKNLKKKIPESKVSILLPNVSDFKKESYDIGKENHTLGYGFKNRRKSSARIKNFTSLFLHESDFPYITVLLNIR